MNWSKTSSFGFNCAHERLHKVYEIIDALDTCGTTGAICLLGVPKLCSVVEVVHDILLQTAIRGLAEY